MNRERPLIMVVDDESHIVHVVSLKLTKAGYDVITAEDGEEGLEMALRHLPDLVITDYQMPFMTGLELCQQLKANELTRTTPALMLTARGFSLAPDLLEQTNISEVISKPFSPSSVLEKVQEIVGKGGSPADAAATGAERK